MANPTVLTGAIALIKVNGVVIGKMRSVRVQEQFRRMEVRGLGTILPSEAPVVEWSGTLSCEFMSIDFQTEGITDAVRRAMPNVASQVLNGGQSFEDQLILDATGVEIDIYKKISDVVDAKGNITPKLAPYAIVYNCLIESDSFDISEAAIAGHSQSFKYLTPVVTISKLT